MTIMIGIIMKLRGWLKSVNNPEDSAEDYYADDLFAFRLHYEDAVGNGLPNTRRFDKNISSMTWKDPYIDQYAYNYNYDFLNRLQSAIFFQKPGSQWSVGNKYNEDNLEYDLNDNIKRIRRQSGTGAVMDNLTGGSLYFTGGAYHIGIEGSIGLGANLWPTWSLGLVGSSEKHWIGIGGTGYYPLNRFE